jgi:hypothetical protein
MSNNNMAAGRKKKLTSTEFDLGAQCLLIKYVLTELKDLITLLHRFTTFKADFKTTLFV